MTIIHKRMIKLGIESHLPSPSLVEKKHELNGSNPSSKVRVDEKIIVFSIEKMLEEIGSDGGIQEESQSVPSNVENLKGYLWKRGNLGKSRNTYHDMLYLQLFCIWIPNNVSNSPLHQPRELPPPFVGRNPTLPLK